MRTGQLNARSEARLTGSAAGGEECNGPGMPDSDEPVSAAAWGNGSVASVGDIAGACFARIAGGGVIGRDGSCLVGRTGRGSIGFA